MRKKTIGIVLILLCLSLAVTAGLVWHHSRKSGKDLPSTRQMITLLKAQGEEEGTDILRGYSLDTLTEVWGEPDGQLFGMFGCIWESDGESFLVYFDDHARVERVKLNERNP